MNAFLVSVVAKALLILESQNDIDVILIDMMMPEIDGYEAIALIKKIPTHKKTPIVAVTAQAITGDREKCLESGADDYISKPINVDQLLLILNSL